MVNTSKSAEIFSQLKCHFDLSYLVAHKVTASYLVSSVTLLGIRPNSPSLLASVTVVVGRTSLTLSPTEWMFRRLPTGTRLINLKKGQIKIYVTLLIWVTFIFLTVTHLKRALLTLVHRMLIPMLLVWSTRMLYLVLEASL